MLNINTCVCLLPYRDVSPCWGVATRQESRVETLVHGRGGGKRWGLLWVMGSDEGR